MIHSLDGLIITNPILFNLIYQFNRCKLTKYLVYLKNFVFNIHNRATKIDGAILPFILLGKTNRRFSDDQKCH